MSTRTTGGQSINRRVIASSLLFSVFPLIGCSSTSPKRGLIEQQVKRIQYVEPRHEYSLKLEISAWANMPSAATVLMEEGRINLAMGSWSDHVVGQFSAALIGTLREGGIDVDAVLKDATTTANQWVGYGASIRSYLKAGFVYKTFTSATFAPFVEVVLDAKSENGIIFYHKLYVATDRPFNLFMTSLPASTDYLLGDIDALESTSDTALKAFGLLAAQLGRKFAMELLA